MPTINKEYNMSNQLQHKAATLAQILASNKLTKSAEQKIDHVSPLSQHDLGREQTKDLHDNVEGVLADTPAAANPPSDTVDELPGVQSLNKDPERALAQTGTSVDTMSEDGSPTGTPAQVAKTAALYRSTLAGIINQMNKRAYMTNDTDFRNGTEVLQKFASLSPNSTAADIAEAQQDLLKLASTNPFFHICRERIMMEKLAEDIDALAESAGISPEQAAEELQMAAEANPEMMEELEDEAEGEAVADLAEAEGAADEFMSGVDAMAANASEALGTEVTADDILEAADQTTELAEQLGVPPEALIEEAISQMTEGDGGAEVTPEDEANAQMILEEAAANGISPEEVIQFAAEELGGGSEEPSEEEVAEMVEKAASLQKRASSDRVNFVRYIRNAR